MCLILLAHGVNARYPLVLAANRDEFHQRPTAPATFWPDAPHVLGGRDLLAGGTWMGVTRQGRWAALTNVRDSEAGKVGKRSRGALVADYLRGGVAARDYIAEVERTMDRFSGFNLLVGDADGVHYVGNRGGAARQLPPGIYGLSNHLLNTPWPKVRNGRRGLEALVSGERAPSTAALLELLRTTDPAPDAELPDTGVGQEWERVLSALFIVNATYGTRASTVLRIDAQGEARFVERSFLPGPVRSGEVRHRFHLEQGGDR